MKSVLRSALVCIYVLLLSATAYANLRVTIVKTDDNLCGQIGDFWKTAALSLGYTVTFRPPSFLSQSVHSYQTDIIIVACDKVNLDALQTQTIKSFVEEGGGVFIQAEFDRLKANNIAFEKLVNDLGGIFAWKGTTNGNIVPQTVLSTMSYVNNVISVLDDAFFFGCYGEGENGVKPILERKDKFYGFMFCPDRISDGRLMCVSDQDWLFYDNDKHLFLQNALVHLSRTIPKETVCYDQPLYSGAIKDIRSHLLNKKFIDLDWHFSPQIDTDEFEVEVENGSGSFQRVGVVAASATLEDYHFYYVAPAPGAYLFRIKAISKNKEAIYSPATEVKVPYFDKQTAGVSIHAQHDLLILTEFTDTRSVRYQLVDVSGRVVKNGVFDAGTGAFLCPDIQTLPRGVYRVLIFVGDERNVFSYLKNE